MKFYVLMAFAIIFGTACGADLFLKDDDVEGSYVKQNLDVSDDELKVKTSDIKTGILPYLT